jgi:hypothetical protein
MSHHQAWSSSPVISLQGIDDKLPLHARENFSNVDKTPSQLLLFRTTRFLLDILFLLDHQNKISSYFFVPRQKKAEQRNVNWPGW